MTRRNLLFVGLGILGLIVFVSWGMSAPSAIAPGGGKACPSPSNASTIYFFGEECPHCKDVAKFLEDNKIADKVSFEKKEVWHDTCNAKEMEVKAKGCGLDTKSQSFGVPFVWSEGKCFVGQPDVEKLFRDKAGMK